MMTPPMSAVEACALVIEAAGWETMARQWRGEPGKRDAIARFMMRDLARRYDSEKAHSFTQGVALATGKQWTYGGRIYRPA